MNIYQERARFSEGWICTVKLVTGLQRALHELTTAGWLYPPVWEERRRQRKPAGVCQGEKLLPRELSASQDYHHSLKSLLSFCQFPFFFFLCEIQKGQCRFTNPSCSIPARGMLSVSNAASSEHGLHSAQHRETSPYPVCQFLPALLFLYVSSLTPSHPCHSAKHLPKFPCDEQLSYLFILLMSSQQHGDPACPPVLLQLPTFWYLCGLSFTFMLQTLCSSKSFLDLGVQLVFDSTQPGCFLLDSLGADTHMLKNSFVVWTTPNICAFSRPLFLLACIQMQMPYVIFTTCSSSLPCRLWGSEEMNFLPPDFNPIFNWSPVICVWERYFGV